MMMMYQKDSKTTIILLKLLNKLMSPPKLLKLLSIFPKENQRNKPLSKHLRNEHFLKHLLNIILNDKNLKI